MISAVLEVGQVGGDRHHHPEDERDRGQQRETDEDQREAQLADLRASLRRSGVAVVAERGVRRLDGRAALGLRRYTMLDSSLTSWAATPAGAPWRTGPATACGRRRGGAASALPSEAQTSIGPDDPLGAARPSAAAAAWLARNAVDSLPAGGLEAKLARADRGPPAAGQARASTRRRRHPPRPHGRSAQAAGVPGPRPPRRADHRRLHRARRRSQRAHGHPSGARPPRRSTRNAETYQEQAFKVLDVPSASRCGATASGSTWRWRICSPRSRGDRRPAARARRLRQALRGRRADHRARAALPAACRATTRSPCAPTSSSAGPTRSSTCCSAATCSARTGSPSRRCSRCRSFPGPTGSARCRSRWATTSA